MRQDLTTGLLDQQHLLHLTHPCCSQSSLTISPFSMSHPDSEASTITIPAWVALDDSAGDGNLHFQEVTSKEWDDDNIDGAPSFIQYS